METISIKYVAFYNQYNYSESDFKTCILVCCLMSQHSNKTNLKSNKIEESS